MKRILCLFAFVLLPVVLQAQAGIARLRDSLVKAGSDSDRLLVYRKIHEYYEYSKTDSVLFYMDQGLTHFRKSGYKPGIARMLMLMGGTHMTQGLLDRAQREEEEALEIFKTLGVPRTVGAVENNLGIIQGKKGNYDAAIRHFIGGLLAFEKARDTAGIVSSYIKLGAANEFSGNLDKALVYYNRALQMVGKNAIADRIYIHNNIAVVYCKKGQFQQGIGYIEKSLRESEDPAFRTLRILPLTNMGEVYERLNEDEKARVYYAEALDIARSEKMYEDMVRLGFNMAQILQKTNKDSALVMMKDALTLIRQSGHKDLLSTILASMVNLYKGKGMYREALAYTDSLNTIQDSLYSIEKARVIENLQSTYELDKSTAKVRELELSEQRNINQRNGMMAVAAILAISLSISIFSFYRSKRINAQLAQREHELKRANQVKDRLFSVIGHDLRLPIANIPLMLDMYHEEGVSEEVRQAILEGLRENADVSLETLENLLQWGKAQLKGMELLPTVFEAGEVLENKIRLVKSSAAAKSISIVNHVGDHTPVYGDLDHFKFIIRNLLTNAVKFTHEHGHIEICADREREPGFTVFSVHDDGIGMDQRKQSHIFESHNKSVPGTANETGNSIGLMLCRQFVLENGGKIWVESAAMQGSVFYFSFPSKG